MEHYKVIESKEAVGFAVRLCSDKILRIELKKGAEIDLPAIKDFFRIYSELTKGEAYALLYYTADGTSTLTFEARKFAAQHSEEYPKLSVAIVITSLSQRLIGNFYLKTIRQRVPYKLFNSLAEAEKWSHRQLSSVSKNNKTLAL